MSREGFGIGFWKPERAGILDENTSETRAFKLLMGVGAIVTNEVFDDLKKESDGVFIHAFVKSLLTGRGRALVAEGYRQLVEGSLPRTDRFEQDKKENRGGEFARVTNDEMGVSRNFFETRDTEKRASGGYSSKHTELAGSLT